MRLIGLAVPLPVHAAWREEPRVWRAVPSSRVRGDDKNQNVLVRGATDRLRRKIQIVGAARTF
jgi:DUF971 family protein